MAWNIVAEHETDEALLARLSAPQSHAAFAMLVRRHAPRFRQLAFRYVGTSDMAEDIVQDAFLKLWDKPGLWHAGSNAKFTTWFYRVVVNQCLDHLRKQKTVPILEGQDFESSDMPVDQQLEAKRQGMQVEEAFRKLPLPMQTSLNLSFYEHVPNAAAAEIMGLSLKAFQSLLMRAKKALKDSIMNQPVAARHYESH